MSQVRRTGKIICLTATAAMIAIATADVSANREAKGPKGSERPPALPHAHKGLLEGTPAQIAPAEPGLTLELTYTSDTFVNARGGRSTDGAVQYRGLLNVAMTLDTESLGLWNDGTFYFNFIDNHGLDISERYVGDLQVLNNADAPNDSRIYEAWYEHRWFDGALRLKLGKMDSNADFAAGLFRGEFVHSSPGFSPTIPLVTYPETAWGASLFLAPSRTTYLRTGVFDALGTSARVGFDTAFHAPADALFLLETGIRPEWSTASGATLPGQYAWGVWHQNASTPIFFNDLDGRLPPRVRSGNTGFYVTLDQWLVREVAAVPEDADRGVGVFFQFGWAPGDRNEIVRHVGAGFEWYGPLNFRRDDVLGFSVQHVELNSTIRASEDRHAETAFEMFYKAQIAPWMTIKPDIQFISNPGGDGRDALIFGIRVEVTL
ncbi:MAG: carbohydrate porin [Phycisphaerae bacterium]